MARPCLNRDLAAEAATRRAVVALRMALKMSRSTFAVMVGMSASLMQAKEVGRIKFRPEEVSRIKQAVADHLAAEQTALDHLISVHDTIHQPLQHP